jgi:hypothetical protein
MKMSEMLFSTVDWPHRLITGSGARVFIVD